MDQSGQPPGGWGRAGASRRAPGAPDRGVARPRDRRPQPPDRELSVDPLQPRADERLDQFENDTIACFDQASIPRVLRRLTPMEQVAAHLVDATDYLREVVPIPDSPSGVPIELPDASLTKQIDGPDVIGI